ncbi:glycosyltransferase family 2 protein [bacterium]|nr:glycosyltransferase family 2 protein [bacterium]
MTSIPPRAHQLPNVINSILNNTVKPDKIIITLCNKYNRFDGSYNMSYLTEFKDNDIIKINFIEKDLGSVTKLIGSLDKLLTEDNIDDIYLLTADDDLPYSKNWIKNFVRRLKSEPNTVWYGFGQKQAHSVKGGIFTAFNADGITYKLNKLHTFKNYCDLLISDNKKWALHDDMCFSSWFKLNNIKMKKIREKSRIYGIYPHVDKHSITKNTFPRNGVPRNNALARSYFKLLNSGALDKFKI